MKIAQRFIAGFVDCPLSVFVPKGRLNLSYPFNRLCGTDMSVGSGPVDGWRRGQYAGWR